MHPYYHPTSVLIVDDDALLLRSLSGLMQSIGQTYNAFNDPQKALDFVLTQNHKFPTHGDFLSAYPEIFNISELQRGDLLIKLKTSSFMNVMNNSDRFSQISVAIVDYDMPGMTGIDFCRKLNDLPLKKIILTGRASQKQAVNAFNERIIDCFFNKKEPNLEDKILQEVARLQKDFFSHNTEALKIACSLQQTEFIIDSAFQDILMPIINENNIVEYYLNTHPPGLLMFDASGKPRLVLVYDEQRLQAHYEIAQEAGAPTAILNKISSQRFIPLFPTNSGYYEPYVSGIWQNYFWPAHRISGQKDWYISDLIDEDFLQYGLENMGSYQSYQQNQNHGIA
ncbi:MAG: response regulator [Pseudomonadota bacterium]